MADVCDIYLAETRFSEMHELGDGLSRISTSKEAKSTSMGTLASDGTPGASKEPRGARDAGGLRHVGVSGGREVGADELIARRSVGELALGEQYVRPVNGTHRRGRSQGEETLRPRLEPTQACASMVVVRTYSFGLTTKARQPKGRMPT